MKELERYNKACIDLTNKFVEKYYDGDFSNVYWIGDKVGEVLSVNDDFYNMYHIVDAFLYELKPNELHKWYYLNMEKAISIKAFNFLK